MKNLGTYLMNSAAAVVLAGVGLVCIVLSLIWPLHPIAWVVLLIGGILALLGMALAGREWLNTQAKIDALHRELSAARAQVSGLTAVTADPQDSPSADQRSAQRIVKLLPTDAGLIQRLRLDPGIGRFATAELEPVRSFVRDFAKASFADRGTHFAFMSLYRGATAFIEWADSQTEVVDGVAELVPGDVRDEGWRSYSEAREEGEQAASTLTAARRDFERTALEDGVIATDFPAPGVD